MTPDDLPPRIAEKIKVDETGCWLWTAGLGTDGYGKAKYHNKTFRAHRLTYELLRARIPADLVLDHLCRVITCVNPAHLEPVTPAENLNRGIFSAGLRRPSRRGMNYKTHCPQGHPYDEANTCTTVGRNGWRFRNCRQCQRDRYHAKQRERVST